MFSLPVGRNTPDAAANNWQLATNH